MPQSLLKTIVCVTLLGAFSGSATLHAVPRCPTKHGLKRHVQHGCTVEHLTIALTICRQVTRKFVRFRVQCGKDLRVGFSSPGVLRQQLQSTYCPRRPIPSKTCKAILDYGTDGGTITDELEAEVIATVGPWVTIAVKGYTLGRLCTSEAQCGTSLARDHSGFVRTYDRRSGRRIAVSRFFGKDTARIRVMLSSALRVRFGTQPEFKFGDGGIVQRIGTHRLRVAWQVKRDEAGGFAPVLVEIQLGQSPRIIRVTTRPE